VARFDRRIGSLEQFADAQASLSRLDGVKRIRRVNENTQLRTGEHLIVNTGVSGTVYVSAPEYSPGKIGIDSRLAVIGSGLCILTLPPGAKSRTSEGPFHVSPGGSVTLMLDGKDSYFISCQPATTYYNRGDPSTWDYSISGGSLTADGNWYSKDLSPIVGKVKRLVHIRGMVSHSSLGHSLEVRERGLNNTFNAYVLTNQVANQNIRSDGWVLTDDAGIVSYRITNATTSAQFVIRGWMDVPVVGY